MDEGQRRRGVDVPAQVAEEDGLHLRDVEGVERSTGQLGDHCGRYGFALIHLDGEEQCRQADQLEFPSILEVLGGHLSRDTFTCAQVHIQ